MLRWLIILAMCAAALQGVDHFVLHDRLRALASARMGPVTDWVRAKLHLPADGAAGQAGTPPATGEQKAAAASASKAQGPSAATAARKETVAPEQLAATKEQLRNEILAAANVHVIHLASGKVINGTVEAETADYVTVRQQIGSSGWFSRKFPKGQVTSVDLAMKDAPQITDEDALIKIEFPTFQLVKEGPVSFFTDQDSMVIKDLVDMLARLRGQLTSTFGPLMQGHPLTPGYVLVFSTEQMYRHYTEGMASHAQNAVGLFIPSLDRLVVFNFFGSGLYQAVDAGREMAGRDLRQQREAVGQSDAKGQPGTRHYVEQLDAAQQLIGSVGARVGLAAKSMNFMVIRHEGTHQFFHALGLDEKPMGRQLWLLEGLATYAETPSVGERTNEQRLPIIKDLVNRHAHRQLRELIQQDDLFTSGDMAHGLAGYAEGWSLVYYLMNSDYRGRFFDYLGAILAMPSDEKAEVSPAERLAFFERHLGVSMTALESQWAKFIQTL